MSGWSGGSRLNQTATGDRPSLECYQTRDVEKKENIDGGERGGLITGACQGVGGRGCEGRWTWTVLTAWRGSVVHHCWMCDQDQGVVPENGVVSRSTCWRNNGSPETNVSIMSG